MLLKYMEQLHAAEKVEDAWVVLSDHMARFGFDRLLYGFTQSRSGNSFGDQQDILVLTSHNDDYIQKFVEQEMYFHGPMVQWAANNVGACSWRWIAENYDTFGAKEREVVAFNKAMDVTAGYSISFRDTSSRAKGAIGLVAAAGTSQQEVDEMWSENGRTILQMNNAAHLIMTSLPYETLSRPLTHRQREVLQWVGEGKTAQDTAQILGLTSTTVEKHLRLAREALSVDTTAQAILKTSSKNQFFVI